MSYFFKISFPYILSNTGFLSISINKPDIHTINISNDVLVIDVLITIFNHVELKKTLLQ